MFATAQEIHEASKSGRHGLSDVRQVFDQPTPGYDRGILTYDGAVDLLSFYEKKIKEEGHIFSKCNRPWNIIDMSKKLDPSKSWLGFEFETGFTSGDARRDVMGWVWDNTMHSVMDYEGSGNYPVEITFAPDYAESYLETKSDMHRLYAYISKKGYELVPHTYAGTHANISIPTFRDGGAWKIGYLVHVINAALQRLDRNKAFGRNPYGWANTADSGIHIELKLFMSATSVEQFDNYVKISIAIKDAMEYLDATWLSTYRTASELYNGAWNGTLSSIKATEVYEKFFSEWH